MPDVELICLANSRKHSGRCVAGIRRDGQGWIRPVAKSDDGTLFQEHFLLKGGTEPRLFDVIKIGLDAARPGPHHPEDWTLTRSQWVLIRRPAEEKDIKSLESNLVRGAELLRNDLDRISTDDVAKRPLTSSLALVEPTTLSWQITRSFRGNRQTRARFRVGKAFYDLSVSDPIWEYRLRDLQIGDYGPEAVGLSRNQRVWLTISLTEPLGGYHYKLVAAVLLL
jgi:hypothetical protein